MYRQILIHPDDRKYKCIIWSTDPNNYHIYELSTVTYGIVPSAFPAIACLRQLAILEGHKYPLASPLIKNNMYVDDSHFGADNLSNAIEMSKQFIQLLNAGGFPLRKWAANDKSLLNHIPEDWLDEINESQVSCLGMSWNNSKDTLSYLNVYKEKVTALTRRTILSLIAMLYDPLGFLSPIVIKGKIFIQSLWEEKLEWDEEVSQTLAAQWLKIYEDLKLAHTVSIPRWINYYSNCSFEIHGFADASIKAMAAVVYFRILCDGYSFVNIVIAKSKVAPLKTITVSRLELCAALQLSTLVSRVVECFNFKDIKIHLWSDSRNALAWILSPPHLWQTFVSHRVAEIQKLLPKAYWHHIDGEINPADLATRGITTSELIKSSLWWGGPDFLSNNSESYPLENEQISNSNCSERRKTAHLVIARHNEEWDLLYRFSSLSKLTRITAWCLRFLNNCVARKFHSPRFLPNYLFATEMKNAEIFWARQIQIYHFQKDYQRLINSKEISNQSPLFNLNIYFDLHTQCIRINSYNTSL